MSGCALPAGAPQQNLYTEIVPYAISVCIAFRSTQELLPAFVYNQIWTPNHPSLHPKTSLAVTSKLCKSVLSVLEATHKRHVLADLGHLC